MVQPKVFTSVEEIDRGIAKLKRRIAELEQLDIREAVLTRNGADDVVESNIRETIRDIFGSNSPEFREHQHVEIWAGPVHTGMGGHEIVEAREAGKKKVHTLLEGLIARLVERREDLGETVSSPQSYFERLNLHPRIADVANDLYMDGYPWEAVFAAAKALVNYIKERSGRHDVDGAALVRTVFSKNKPILAFNDLANQTDMDEQEGMMHLLEGAVLAIRNPGGHSFPEGSAQRALEYISLISLLAYRMQEAKRRN